MDNHRQKSIHVLEIIEHPEDFSPKQIAETLSDPEARDLYDLISKTDATVLAAKEIDTDEEWIRFCRTHTAVKPSRTHWIGNRAASIAAIILTSLVAVAAGIGITIAVTGQHSDTQSVPHKNDKEAVATESVVPEAASSQSVSEPVVYEDVPLETILDQIAATYGIEVSFHNEEVAGLHLYYRFDPELPLDKVVEQLNVFEQISITQEGNTLIVD